jgi:hypothetical protein
VPPRRPGRHDAASTERHPDSISKNSARRNPSPPGESRVAVGAADRSVHDLEEDTMKRRLAVAAGAASLLAVAATAYATSMHGHGLGVRAREYDPKSTHLVQATWVDGLGCPTRARTATFDAGGNLVRGPSYTDSACPTGDWRDRHVRGLLLAKTGPTANVASATARVVNVRGKKLSELGYDIRKVGSASDPRGSHCGAGAPRFNVVTANGSVYFIGCNSPAADTATVGEGWIRLRWGGSGPLNAFPASGGGPTDIKGMTVRSLSIVFDEGQDTGPDFLGLTVLDNIDVNGRLVGTGGVSAGNR